VGGLPLWGFTQSGFGYRLFFKVPLGQSGSPYAKPPKDKSAARSQAVLTYCALIGAIGVARAVSDEWLSREMLKTVAARLKERH
jgi:hypothetical protein